MCYPQPGQVSDILTQHLLAIHTEIGKWAVAVKLRYHLRTRGAILRQVISTPPVNQPSTVVVNVPELIKAVTDFVSDTSTSGSIVGRGITIGVEVRSLQQTGREEFGIGAEHDHCANGLRIDSPFSRIGWLLQLGEAAR